MRSIASALLLLFTIAAFSQTKKTPKAVFIIADGIPFDVLEKLNPPTLAAISKEGGFTKAHVGGDKDSYNQTPTISAPGYNDLITGTWGNKHNVWDNNIAAPNYNYWNIFRIAKNVNPKLQTAIFSTWLDNRTKLVGDGLKQAGSIKIDYAFDGLENDTVKYPHDKGSTYIDKIDEAVSTEAARYIADKGPDLSWVYLEYTDDMGHRFGDSEQLYAAVRSLDERVKKIWDAISLRQQKHNEDWLIVITTDHGRDAISGKSHGGQSERERTTWIVTNTKNLNDQFLNNPGIVDILPAIFKHMNITIPEEVAKELDGVSFIGEIDFTNLRATKTGNTVQLTWKNMGDSKSTLAEVYVTRTNLFKEGKVDAYNKIGQIRVHLEKFEFQVTGGTFYKIVVKTPGQWGNVWVK